MNTKRTYIAPTSRLLALQPLELLKSNTYIPVSGDKTDHHDTRECEFPWRTEEESSL